MMATTKLSSPRSPLGGWEGKLPSLSCSAFAHEHLAHKSLGGGWEEGYPGMWVPALLYEPIGLKNKVPGVLNPNGHHAGGKAEIHKQARCINLAKRGMLALSTEFIGMGELTMNREHNRIGHMDLCGVAGVSVFYLAMRVTQFSMLTP